MMPLTMPENAQVFYGELIELISFDPLPDTDDYYADYLKIDKGDAFTDRAEEVGYESKLMSFNSGSVFIFGLLMVTNQMLYLLIRGLCFMNCKVCGRSPRDWAAEKQSNFIWSGACDYFEETYLLFALGFCLNWSQLSFASPGLIVNDCYAVFAGLIVIFYPPSITYKMNSVWRVDVNKIDDSEIDPDTAYVDNVYMTEQPRNIKA